MRAPRPDEFAVVACPHAVRWNVAPLDVGERCARRRIALVVTDYKVVLVTASQSQIRQHSSLAQTGATSTRSRDYSLTATWQPSERLSINYRWSDLDSGTLGSDFFTPRSRQLGGGFNTGFQNPWGVGYNGNGFSSGAPLYSGYTYYGVRGKGQELGVQWRPNDLLTIDLQWSDQRSAGDFQTNSAQKVLTAGVSYLPYEWLMINLNWSRQEVQFLTASGFSNNEYLTVGVEIGPIRRWQISLNYYQMTTQSVLGEGFVGGAGSFDGNRGSGWCFDPC